MKPVARRKGFGALRAAALVVILTCAFYWVPLVLTRSPRPTTAAEVLAAQNSVRTVCVAALVAVGTAAATVVAWRSYTMNRAGQFTDRYGAAVAQLAADAPEIRIGGCYALESLAEESATYRAPVHEVLSAFLRNHPAAQPTAPGLPVLPLVGETAAFETAAQDVQAAFAVLGRLPRDPRERPLDLRRAGLAHSEANNCDLSRAWLHQCDLQKAHIRDAKLVGAGLNRADLRCAGLDRSDLRHARIDRAWLAGASFIDARLDHAKIRSADLTGAMLYRANLSHVDLGGSTLIGARLDAANLTNACLDNTDLTGANLAGSLMVGASLRGATLTGARVDRRAVTASQIAEAVNADAVVWG